MSLPPWARVVVYILIVLAFVHNYLKPTVLQGQLWIIDKMGDNNPGVDYELRHGISAFRVNTDGRWTLTTQRKLPGSIVITIVDSKNRHQADVELGMPVPVWSGFFPKQYSITGNLQGTFKVTETASIRKQLIHTAYAQSQSPTGDTNHGREVLYVKINKLRIKEIGDSRGSTGELYFRVFLNNDELKNTGLPAKGYPNTHLLINNNTTTNLKNLGFFLPISDLRESKYTLIVKLYDYDLFGSDEKVGEFRAILNSNTKLDTPHTYKTEKLKKPWPDNSEIEMEFHKAIRQRLVE